MPTSNGLSYWIHCLPRSECPIGADEVCERDDLVVGAHDTRAGEDRHRLRLVDRRGAQATHIVIGRYEGRSLRRDEQWE